SQDGIIKSTGYDRYSLRYNFNNRMTSWLNMGFNSFFSYNKQNFVGLYEGADQLPAMGYTFSPLDPIRLTDGSYMYKIAYGVLGATGIGNPVAAQDYNFNRINSYRGLGNIYAEFKFLKHFQFRTNLGTDFMLSESKEKIDPRLDINNTTSPGTINEVNI